MGYLNDLLSRHANSIFASPTATGKRGDIGAPLGIQIGCKLMFPDMPFIISMGAGHLMKKPEVVTVAAYGRIVWGDITIHRFYFTGDTHFLEVSTFNADGKVVGATLYQVHEDIYPATPESWQVWIPAMLGDEKARYLIGFHEFTLNDPKTGTPLNTYSRVWPSAGDTSEQVPPVEMLEVLYPGPTAAPIYVNHQVMQYGRAPERPASFQLGATVPDEWLLLAVSTYPTKAEVRISVGLDINPELITVAQLVA